MKAKQVVTSVESGSAEPSPTDTASKCGETLEPIIRDLKMVLAIGPRSYETQMVAALRLSASHVPVKIKKDSEVDD